MKGTHQTWRLSVASLVASTLLLVTVFPLAAAGSEDMPEISDAEGDVSPAAFASNETLDEDNLSALYQNVTAYDVVKSWIALETASDFWLFIKVRDLPDGWGAAGAPPEQSPFGANATQLGTTLKANFSVAGEVYEVVARLAMPKAGMLLDNYTILHGDDESYASGTYNTTQDWVAIDLPKDAFAGLADGVKLTNFWIQGMFGALPMDYAPNARNAQSGSTPDPMALLDQVASGALVEPNYGLDYTFGQYYHPGSGGGNWPAVPNVQLSLLSAQSSAEIDAGDSATYKVRVSNMATKEDTVYLALNSASEGWSHQLSESKVTLASTESATIELTVSAAEGASDSMLSSVTATSMLGGHDMLSVLTKVKSMSSGDDGSSDDGGSGDDGGFQPTSPKAKSPGFEFVIGAAAAVAVLVLVRRRR